LDPVEVISQRCCAVEEPRPVAAEERRQTSRLWLLAEIAAVVLVATAFSVFLTRPLAFQLNSNAGPDSELTAFFQAWGAHTLFAHPSRLFDAPMFYPARNTLALSENLIGTQWIFAPVYAITHNAMVASNVVLITSFLFCALAMYLLARHLTGSPWASAIAAFVYAFAPARLGQLGHMQLLSMQWLPLIVLFLLRFVSSPTWLNLVGLTGSVLMQCLCSLYLGYMAMIVAACYFAPLVISQRGLPRKAFLGLVASAILTAGIMYPVCRPYFRSHADGGLPASGDLNLTTQASASPLGSYLYLSASPGHPFYKLFQRHKSLQFFWEKQLFVGFLPLGLALLGCAAWYRHCRVAHAIQQRDGSIEPAFWGTVLTVASSYLLSLGPYLRIHDRPTIRLPFFWLRTWIPGFANFRVPARFGMVLMFGLALLAAWGFMYLLRFVRYRARIGTALTAALTVLILAGMAAEYDSRALCFGATVSVAGAPEYRWLARQRPGSVTLEIPTNPSDGWPEPYEEAPYVYADTFHWQPLINGYSGYAPMLVRDTFRLAHEMPSESSLAALGSMGLRYVVVHTNRISAAEGKRWQELDGRDGVREAAQFNDGARIYEVDRADCSVGLEQLQLNEQLPVIVEANRKFSLELSAETGYRCWVSTHGTDAVPISGEWRNLTNHKKYAFSGSITVPSYGSARTHLLLEGLIQAPTKPGKYSLQVLSFNRRPVTLPAQPVVATSPLAANSLNSPSLLGAKYQLLEAPRLCEAGESCRIAIQTRNTGAAMWIASSGPGQVKLGYVWLNARTGLPIHDGRIELPYPVYPGTPYTFFGEVQAPTEPGEYVLKLDLVSELITWFEQVGAIPVRVPIQVPEQKISEELMQSTSGSPGHREIGRNDNHGKVLTEE
jgi:hypothetical protein